MMIPAPQLTETEREGVEESPPDSSIYLRLRLGRLGMVCIFHFLLRKDLSQNLHSVFPADMQKESGK
jgi:hypothetical protein